MQHRFLTLHCLAPLHCGTGQGVAGIDLPIQRERHTGWPVIPGSSIKGVLRDAARQACDGDPAAQDGNADVIALFGPDSGAAELGLGALSFGDARLLAFPVRSLCGTFAWLTCPLALQGLARLPGAPTSLRDAGMLRISDEHILAPESLIAANNQVVLEDQALSREALPAGLLAALTPFCVDDATAMLNAHLAVVSDDVFSWFARHATQVETRIALDVASKTVKNGALFSQETVPPESMFISHIAAENARHAAAKKSAYRGADQALNRLGEFCQQPRQFGGDATIGKGLCALKLGEGK